MTVPVIDAAELELLTQTLVKTMTTAPSGIPLYEALTELGWHDLLAQDPDAAVPLVFRLLGETGAHAPLLDDVITAAGAPAADLPLRLPYAGGATVLARGDNPPGPPDRAAGRKRPYRPRDSGAALDSALVLAISDTADPLPGLALAAGRRALGWWLLGAGRAMLALARTHALDRVQFGKPIASFQAVRHKLAETHVALDGASAVLNACDGSEFSSLVAKAAAGRAALTAAKHSQQVLGGIGFTAEHSLHIHVKRVLVLDGLLGSARELTREAGHAVIAAGSAPRLVDL
jgi:hypothetical protein